MTDAADLVAAIAQLIWPFLFAAVVLYLRRELRAMLQPGAELAFELFGGKLHIKPTKPPTEQQELPSVSEREELPPDYVFLNHSSFLRESEQERFQQITGVDARHYDIRVIVDSYYRGALDRIDRVEYVLHQAYPEPIQVRTRAENRFLLKELANGEYVLLAKVFFRDRRRPLILQRYITLWESGPRLD